MKGDGAWLAREAEPAFGPVDIVAILLPGQRSLRRIGIDREAVEIIAAAGHGMGANLPLGKGAVEVMGDRAAHFGDFDVLVVVGVLQVGGEVLPQSALARFRDHGLRPSALKQTARISVSGRRASSINARSASRPRPDAQQWHRAGRGPAPV
jgi:hypothetical protein